MKFSLIYPILLACYPVLFLFANNLDLVHPVSILRPLVVYLILTLSAWMGFSLVMRNKQAGAVMASFMVIWLSFYIHIWLEMTKYVSEWVATILYWVGILFVLVIVIINLMYSRVQWEKISKFVTVFSLVVLLLPLVQIGTFIFSQRDNRLADTRDLPRIQSNASSRPDIYHIVLDSHGRSDILKEIYGYDNSRFIQELQSRGFYVAEKSTSNYPRTFQSMTSSFNFDYLNSLIEHEITQNVRKKPYSQLLNYAKLFRTLRELDYQIVIVANGWHGTDGIPMADKMMRSPGFLTEFENVLLTTSVIRDYAPENYYYGVYRNQILYAFEHVPDMAEDEAHTFTYAHIIAPHPPFVFDEQGNHIVVEPSLIGIEDVGWKSGNRQTSVEDYKEAYRDQLAFVDKQVIEMIDEIFNKSTSRPVIILQSDHGPASEFTWENPSVLGMRERFSTLQAYYFPEGKGYDRLYQTITPVNTYRVILNLLWGADLPLLDDRNYFASDKDVHEFRDVTEIVGQ